MTAAGVQNLEPTAYLPPSPSIPLPDAKGAGALNKQTGGAQSPDAEGEPSDFQSELQLHDTGASENKPADAPAKGSEKSKKRNTQPQGVNLTAVTPVQVAQPQKQILPLVLTLAKPDEQIKTDEQAKPDEIATTEGKQEIAQDLGQVTDPRDARLAMQGLPLPNTPGIQVAELPQAARQPVRIPPSAKHRQSAPSMAMLPNQAAATATGLPEPPDSSKAQTLTLPVPVLARQDGAKSEDQPSIASKPATSEASQPASKPELPLPATIPEPAAPAIQAAADSSPSGPSALAFAARLGVASPKDAPPKTSADSGAENPSQDPAGAGAQPDRIPVRYAATAQILKSAALGLKHEDELKSEAGPASDRTSRSDSRADMVLPQFETTSDVSQSSEPAAPQQSAPSARAEQIIEPPAAPPTSPNDIRVQVPDNKGGSAQVRFVESGGEVRVSVRTADEGLAQNLRTHLNDLTQRLSEGGMSSEIWKPNSTAAPSQSNSQQPSDDGRGSSGQGSSGQGSGGQGSSGQGSGGQGEQQEGQQQRPAWLEEMETSLHGSRN